MEIKEKEDAYFSVFRISDWPLSENAVRLLSGGKMAKCKENDKIAKQVENVSNDYVKAMIKGLHSDKDFSEIRRKFVKFNDCILECRQKDFDGVKIGADMERFNQLIDLYQHFVMLPPKQREIER